MKKTGGVCAAAFGGGLEGREAANVDGEQTENKTTKTI